MSDVTWIERTFCWEKDRRGKNGERLAVHRNFLKVHRCGKSDEMEIGYKGCCLSIEAEWVSHPDCLLNHCEYERREPFVEEKSKDLQRGSRDLWLMLSD